MTPPWASSLEAGAVWLQTSKRTQAKDSAWVVLSVPLAGYGSVWKARSTGIGGGPTGCSHGLPPETLLATALW